MKNTYTPFLIFLLVCVFQTIQAQDPRFSQFYASPLNLNPAMTGVYEGQFRVVANYRELYNSVLGNQPFRTISASFDYRHQLNRGSYAGFGVNLMRDAAGISNFNRQFGAVSASVMKQLGGGGYRSTDQFLVAGAQIGVGQQGIDFNRLWFSNQYDVDNGAVNYDNPTGEGFMRNSSDMYIDFNAGVLWYALFDERQSIYFGAAMHHLNSPNISFLDQDDKLPSRWVAHMGGELPFGKELSILPAIAVMGQNQSLSTTAGANFRYTNREWRELAMRVGGWAHAVNDLESGFALDAITVAAILELEDWNLGFSYDVTTSTLTAANNGRGAFEVSLIYTHPAKVRRKDVNCPNF